MPRSPSVPSPPLAGFVLSIVATAVCIVRTAAIADATASDPVRDARCFAKCYRRIPSEQPKVRNYYLLLVHRLVVAIPGETIFIQIRQSRIFFSLKFCIKVFNFHLKKSFFFISLMKQSNLIKPRASTF